MEGKNTTISEEMCKKIKTPEEMKKLCKKLQAQIVEYMLKKYKSEILEGKEPSEFPTMYIIGGQNASGKSKLISMLKQKNSNTVSVIIDDMKAHHPFRQFIDKNFPSQSEEILHLACFEVFDRLLKDLLDSNYDITIERTLGSKEKMRKFIVEPSNHNYDIQIHVTATHEINSLIAALERFICECILKDEFISKNADLKIDPRPIALEHHDNTCANICDVINDAENGCFKNDRGERIYPQVHIWDRTPGKPSEIYTTGDGRFSCAKEAMYFGREKDLKRCKSKKEYGYQTRINNIKGELASAQEGSTLYEYIEYCNEFLSEIERRGTTYIGNTAKSK